MSEELIGFGGYQADNGEELKGKGGFGKFGLQQGANLTKLELNLNAGKDNSPGEAVDITLSYNGKDYMLRLYPTTKVYLKGDEIDSSHPEYIKEYNKDWAQKRGVMTHIMKAFVTEDQLKTALNHPTVVDFVSWAKAHINLLPAQFQTKPLDIFLQYQWEIKGDNKMTFLELPKNMKGGYWICAAQPGTFTEDRTGGSLRYVNENGVEHPFTRDTNFMESPKANQQREDGGNSSAIESSTPTESAAW